MDMDPAAIQRAVADGVRDATERLSETVARAVEEGVRRGMREERPSDGRDTSDEMVQDIRNILDRLEPVIEQIESNTNDGEAAP